MNLASEQTHPSTGVVAASRILRPQDLYRYKACETATEGLLYLMVLFSPWAFGTTQPWAIRTMDVAGYILGLLLALKLWVRWHRGYRPPRWGRRAKTTDHGPLTTDHCGTKAETKKQKAEMDHGPTGPCLGPQPGHRFVVRRHKYRRRRRGWEWRATAGLAVLAAAILGYCLVSDLNASATYEPQTLSFVNHQHVIKWLPHSLDSASTWSVFWDYLAVACAFFALRDWLLGK